MYVLPTVDAAIANTKFYKPFADPKSERNLLLLRDKLLRDEFKEEVEQKTRSKSVSRGRSKEQTDSKKQSDLENVLWALVLAKCPREYVAVFAV